MSMSKIAPVADPKAIIEVDWLFSSVMSILSKLLSSLFSSANEEDWATKQTFFRLKFRTCS